MIRRVIVATALIVCSATAAAHAASRLVTTAGTDSGDCLGVPCRSIQYAVTQSTDGDTVSVGSGQYTESITITDKALTITGTDAETVVVQARKTGPVNGTNVFAITAGSKRVTLERLTIRHGDIGVSASGTVSVRDCILQRNGYDGAPYPNGLSQEDLADFYGTHATDGGAIVIVGGSGYELSGNTIHTNDRAIVLTDSAGALIRNNMIHDNIRDGIALVSSTGTGSAGNTNTTISGNTIEDNRAAGVTSVGGKALTIADNTVDGNWNAGIALFHPAQVTIEGNTLDNNNQQTFTGFGALGESWGAIAADGATVANPSSFTLKVLDNIIANTGAGRTDAGTGVRYAANVPNVEVRGNQFIANPLAVHFLAQAKTADVHFNNFEQAASGLRNDDVLGSVSAERNWWGCTGGASTTGCSGAVGSASVDSSLTTPFPATAAFAEKKIQLGIDQTATLKVDGMLLNGNKVEVTNECRFETLDDTVAALESATVVRAASEGATALLATCFDGAYVTAASVIVGTASATTASDADTSAGSASAALGDFSFGGGAMCTLVPANANLAWQGRSLVLNSIASLVFLGVFIVFRRLLVDNR